MNILYYKSDKGNFGDDLNPWLWSKLFEKQLQNQDNNYFLGIGSILHSGNIDLKNIVDQKKIVFGTGIRPSHSHEKFKIDKTWDIKFLRGPLSSSSLGNKHEFISDAAYAIRQLETFPELQNTDKKYEVSIMPYFHSMRYFNWEKIAKKLGYNLISPYSENGVEHTLREIAASKYLICEAMHGAILADILRVPWHRFILTTPYTEGERVSDFKWNDWLLSVDLHETDVSFIPFYQKTVLHEPIKKISANILSMNFLIKSYTRGKLMKSLEKISSYSLSSDSTIDIIDERIHEKVHEFKNIY